MGIPIGGGRRKRRRRSYADYKPPSRNRKPKDDPFRIFFYLILIGAGVWFYFNQDPVLNWVSAQAGRINLREDSGVSIAPKPTQTPPPDPGEFAAEGEQAYLEGNLVEAIEYYRYAAELAPNTVEYHFQLTRLLLFQSAMEYGDQLTATLEEAQQAANGAILANPERPEGYAIMGKVLDWQGDADRAISEITRALEIDENYAVGQSYLAEAMVDLNRWDQAQQTIEKALALSPDNVDVRRDYAYILETLGDYAGASTQYEAALKIHPKLPYLHVALARTYREVGRYQEALDQLFEVEALDPSNPVIPFEIGRTYESYVGDPNSALEYYERAVEADELYPFPWARIGTIRYFQGSYVQAIPAFERALSLGLDSAVYYLHLGLSYAYEEDCDRAILNLQEAQTRSQGDEAILDAVQSGLELCAVEPETLTPEATESGEGDQ